ncbi:MAG: M16 family metallopeptidase [Flavobacteriales bacterium]
MNMEPDRTQAPPAGPAPHVHLGGHHSFTMKNGMCVIVVEDRKIPIVSLQVRFDHAPVPQGDKVGYLELMGELLTSGTDGKTKAEIDEEVDSIGAKLMGSTDGLYASCLTRNFPQLFKLIGEVVTTSNFPEAEFAKAKTRLVSQIGARADDPDQIAEVVGHALTFGKQHPYGEVASEATVDRMGRSDILHYYQRIFQPVSGYLVLVGDINEEVGMAMAEATFGSWTGHEQAPANGEEAQMSAAPVLPSDKRVAFVDRPGSGQSVIKVVFPLDLKPNDPMALHAQVLNTILGGGVFNARLMQNLREDKGYTYGAYSSIESDRWAGNFSAGCSVRNEVTEDAVSQIMMEITGIREEPVKADELALAKSYMAGSFARSLEDPRTVARFALNTFLYGLPADHYETYLQRLEAVDIAGVQAAAKRFLHPAQATMLVVSDKAEVMGTLTGLVPSGKVQEFDINGDPVTSGVVKGA